MPGKYVYARISAGRLRWMLRSKAVEKGLEIVKFRPVGFGAGTGVRREFMTQKERNEVFLKTGVRVEDRADMRAVFKMKGLREAEKGEVDYDRFDALIDHAESGGPLDEKYKLGNIDLWGDRAKEDRRMKEFNHRERYLQHCQRLGVRPE